MATIEFYPIGFFPCIGVLDGDGFLSYRQANPARDVPSCIFFIEAAPSQGEGALGETRSGKEIVDVRNQQAVVERAYDGTSLDAFKASSWRKPGTKT